MTPWRANEVARDNTHNPKDPGYSFSLPKPSGSSHDLHEGVRKTQWHTARAVPGATSPDK